MAVSKRGPNKVKTFRNTEIAEALGVHRHTVAKLLETGELQGNTLADVVDYVRRERAELVDKIAGLLK